MLRKEKFLRSFNKIPAVQLTVEIKLCNTIGLVFSRTSVLMIDFLSKVEFQTNLCHSSFTLSKKFKTRTPFKKSYFFKKI